MSVLRKHVLLPKDIEKKLPSFEEDENVPFRQKVVYLKFFSPYNAWRWYVTSYDPKTKIFFGLVRGWEDEWGYFSLEELESVTINVGKHKIPAIERDLWFTPKTVGDLAKEGEIPERVIYS